MNWEICNVRVHQFFYRENDGVFGWNVIGLGYWSKYWNKEILTRSLKSASYFPGIKRPNGPTTPEQLHSKKCIVLT
jgi:hypothetical protein